MNTRPNVRLLALLTALLLLSVLAGCQSEKTPYARMTEAMDATASAEALTCDFSTRVEVDAAPLRDGFEASGRLVRSGSPEAPVYELTMESEDTGSHVLRWENDTLSVDGEVLDAETLGASGASPEQLTKPGTPVRPAEQDFITLDPIEENGRLVYYGMVKASAVQELYGDALIADFGLDLSGLTWSDMTVQLEVTDGLVTRQTLIYSMSTELDNVAGSVYVVTELLYHY